MESLQLPYYRDPQYLLAPLPTQQEIEASPIVLAQQSVHRVVALPPHFIVKYGTFADEIEGQNLLFIEQTLGIRAPRLYAMYRNPNGKLYIVMEAIRGNTLEYYWPTLSELEKKQIMGELRPTFEKMRALIAHNFFGTVVCGALPHPPFWPHDNDASLSGPFSSEHDLNMAFSKRSRANWAYNGKHGYISDFFENNRSKVLKDHPPTLTHSDLQRKNIIVRKTPPEDSALTSRFEVSIMDWESAGWYPSYWEYANALLAYHWVDDWLIMLETSIQSYPAEGALFKMIWQDLIY